MPNIKSYLDELVKEALRSDIRISKHAALIIDPRRPKWCRVISKSYNTRYSLDKVSRLDAHQQDKKHYTIHAEVNAICQKKSVIRKNKGLVMCVVKVDRNGILSYSRPCVNCQKMCNKYNIETVFYS